MSTRGVISSFAWSSESLRTPSIISTSSERESSLSAADSRTDISSSSDRARLSRSSAGAKACDVKLSARLNGRSAMRQNESRRAVAGASSSQYLSAILFGVISPKRSRRTVIEGTASHPPQGMYARKAWNPIVEMAKFTRVLPTSSVENSTALSARHLAMSASAEAFLARILSRCAPVKEKSTVSAPEKNAESRNSAGNAISTAMRGIRRRAGGARSASP